MPASPPDSHRRFALVTLAGLLLLVGWDAGGLDLPAARLLAGAAGFALQDNWILTSVLHQGVLPLAWLLAGWITVGVWWPTLGQQRLPAADRVQWAGSVWLALLVVDLMKLASTTSCPWDLKEFGGAAIYLSHWAWGQPDGGSGHCFPAGHASAGFVFVAGFFAWRRHLPAIARRWLVGGLLAGSVLGLSQQLRGAHFTSHTLWTAWICWTLAWAAHALPAVAAARAPLANKVPQAVFLFWVIDLLATTIGETAGDAVSRTLGLGYAGASLVFLAVFVAALLAQLRSTTYRPPAYWLLVAASATTGTTIADYLDVTVGLGHAKTAVLLAIALAVVLGSWRRSMGRVAFDDIRSRPEEAFYWATLLVACTLGTAVAECIAQVTGFVGGALLLSVPLALLAWLRARRALPPALLFWTALVLTRPLGAMLGDTLTETQAEGGLALGRIGASLAIATLIVGVTMLMSWRQRRGAAALPA